MLQQSSPRVHAGRATHPDTPFDLRFIDLPGGPIYYRQAGNGPPLLLLHGWGASSRYWAGTLADLADIRSCYALDMPGFGASPPLDQMASVAAQASQVIAFADALGLRRVDLLGHSFGAAVAIVLAARWPERVGRLVLTSFGISASAADQALLDAVQRPLALTLELGFPWLSALQPWIDLWRPHMAMFMNTPPVASAMMSWFMENPAQIRHLMHEGIDDFMRMDWRTHLACIASVDHRALAQALGGIRAPLLLVAGQQDRIVPAELVAATAPLAPRGQLSWIANCGHIPMFEQPQIYHQIVRDFLGS